MNIKVSFGLQQSHIERIESELARWDNLSESIELDNLKGYMAYDRDFWIRLGSEFGWEPLTLSLYYFRYRNTLREDLFEDCVNLLEDLEVPEHLQETYGNLIMNSRNILDK